MNEETNENCQQKDKILKMICEVEKNYGGNFNKQAELFKSLFNQSTTKEHINSIIRVSAIDSRKSAINAIENDVNFNDILFLGIPSLDARTLGKQMDTIESLVKIMKEDNILQKLKYSNIKVNAITTLILFLFFPEKFIPIAGPVNDLLCKLGISKQATNWTEYEEVLKQLKEKFKDYCYEEGDFKPSFTIAFSFTSRLMENQVDKILNKFIDKDKNKPKNIILTGIPGTGKTHTINEYLKLNYDKEQYAFVQFHPSYDYEDFIEGLKPIPKDGQIEFKLVNGVFKELCKKAYEDKDKTYVMVIDEINRANLSRVFGELLYCLEYRDEFVSTKMTTYIESLENKEDYSVSTDNIGKFAIPNNVIILGTMNEVDRSIDAFDLALRRRFIWEEVGFNESAFNYYTPFFTNNFQRNIEGLVKKAIKLNTQLSKDIGLNYQLGHTYYFKIIDYFDGNFESALCDLWEYHLKSIVKEYCKVKFSQSEIEKKLQGYKEIIVGKNNCDD